VSLLQRMNRGQASVRGSLGRRSRGPVLDLGEKARFCLGWVILLGIAGWVAGCSSGGGVGVRSNVASLHLFAAPAAMNLDAEPGADAIGLRLFASGRSAARGIPIGSGTLEIVMYDGSVSEAALASTSPRKVWKFSAQELRPFAATSSLGTGYQLALSWGTAVPRQSSASVIARYRDPAGREISSMLNTISLTAK